MTSAIINGYDTTNYIFAAGDYLIVTKNGVMAGSSPISGQATNIGTPSSSHARAADGGHVHLHLRAPSPPTPAPANVIA